MAFPDSRLQRGYVQLESAWGVAPNSSGVSTVAGADAFLFTDLEMNYSQAVNERPDKTGALGDIVGTAGRKSATWRMRCSLAGSGAAGTVPDIDAFLVAAFGKAATISAGVSATYDPEDAAPSLTIWDFNALAGATQRCITGAIVTQMMIEWGQDFAFIEFSGEGKHVLDTDQFSSADTTAKSGLTAFPTEPSSPAVNGTSVAGYKGTITLDGNAYTTFQSGRLTMAIARELSKQDWGSDYPGSPANGKRAVSLDFALRDDDSANTKALKGKAHSNTTVNLSFAIGTAAGNIWTPSVRSVLLAKPAYDYSQTYRVVNFNGCKAHMSTITGKDEVRLVCA